MKGKRKPVNEKKKPIREKGEMICFRAEADFKRLVATVAGSMSISDYCREIIKREVNYKEKPVI